MPEDRRKLGLDIIRLLARYPDLKIIVLSAFGEQYMDETIGAGANGYILKTATQPELVSAVVQAAGGQATIDPKLVPTLVSRFSELSRMDQRQRLPSRQQEILRLIADGVPSEEIAGKLSVSRATLNRGAAPHL